MFVRNVLRAGDFVSIVPSGIRVTLQYNENGILEKVYTGHANNQVLNNELLTPVLKSDDIPSHIPIKKGSSFVYGCLYTEDMIPVEGRLDKEVESAYIVEYMKDPSKFHFFAGNLQSYALGFNGPMPIRRWLSTVGFNTLPGYLVPSNLTEDKFPLMLNLDKYPFRYPHVQSYILIRGGRTEYISTMVKQVVVKGLRRFTDYSGYILADIESHNLGTLTVPYPDLVNLNIHVGSILLVNEDNNIIDCYNPDSVDSTMYSREIFCNCCGKKISIPRSGRVKCSESHCLSVMNDNIHRLTSHLGINLLDSYMIKELGSSMNNIISLPDILDLDFYDGVEITIEASKLLEACVPATVIPRYSDWIVFCNKCNNSVDTILYYLQNPDNMMHDLNLDKYIYSRFYNWIQDPENLNDVVGLFNHDKIHVVSTGKKFDGAPIFRNKSIYVTGNFSHGDLEDVRAILTSYSATVYDKFNTAVDCVVVGDLHENIDGTAMRKAKRMKIPIFEESEFFSKYDIESDMKKMLVNL